MGKFPKFALAFLAVALVFVGIAFAPPAWAKTAANPPCPVVCTPTGGVLNPFPVTLNQVGPPMKINYGFICLTQASEPTLPGGGGGGGAPIPGTFRSSPPPSAPYPYITVTFYDDGTYNEQTTPQPPAASYSSGSGSYK
jgi:hypothetical protein